MFTNNHKLFKKTFLFVSFLFITQIIYSQNSTDSNFASKNTPVIYVNVIDVAKKLGAKFFFDPLTESGSLEKNGHCITFRTNESVFMFDYQKLAILDAPIRKDGLLLVSKNFMLTAEEFFKTIPPETHFRVGAILIDAGHGGKDPGALATHTFNGKKITIREKDITLTVAKNLNAKLKVAYPDKQILMTRTDDKTMTLEQRVEIANNVKLQPHEAIIYVSIHVNAAFNKNANGYEVWYLSPGYRRDVLDKDSGVEKELLPILNSMMEEEFTTESILIAKLILDSLEKEIGTQSLSRGLKEEEWFVCRNANMPSVLVEVGFLTNKNEAELLNDQNYLSKVANGIYNGIEAFVYHFEKSRGFD
ncbi:MAG: N-acetylmuramoyl-L-alanine amidase [Treponema sp.]|nr:N-acetylmuramoyl-L-alanine amidase [Treponema sp.]